MRRMLRSIGLRRVLPTSLQGQVLLAIAAALLVAQAIGAVLVWRAQMERAEAETAHALAFRIVAGRVVSADDERRFARLLRRDRFERNPGERPDMRPRHMGPRRGMGPMRLERVDALDRYEGDRPDSDMTRRLREILREQGMAAQQLAVFSRRLEDDERASGFAERRLDSETRPSRVIVAAVRTAPGEGLILARVFEPPRLRALGWPLIAQTLLIYLVLVGVVALVLRRITGPMRALTQRVEAFAANPALPADGQVAPQGPLDTRRLIAAHNRMEARIGALLDEKDVMLGAIGHDLKTPLAALRVRIECVDDDAEREALSATIADITATLDDILSLARVGRPSDPLEVTELSALVASVVEEYEDMGENVELGETSRIVLPLRATWLRRALRNLVGNALRYAGGCEVCVERRGNRAIVRVEDEGPGIPDADIAFMLEPFRRGDPSRNRGTGGAGLGLTLARAIAEQHGGTLSITNRADGKSGIVAELALPV
ncbi:MAG: two-component sensor histidine kinase [Croceicoccus sp.]|nr:two-component sensor histidine kinase [Croceicoccus sp.]